MLKVVVVAACVLCPAVNAVAQSPLQVQSAEVAPPKQQEADVPFSALFTGLGNDFRRLPSRTTAVFLGIGGAASLAVHPRDEVLTRRASGSEPLDEVLDGGAVAGGGVVQFGAAFGAYFLGRASGHPRLTLLGADLVRGQIVNAVLTQGVKFAVQRHRPDGGRYSFPSGHTSSAFATAAVIQRHFGWKAAAPAYALATYVGASRLSENKHFASDVIFGAAVGLASGYSVTVGRGPARFDVFPMAAPGGGGVTFSLVQDGRPKR